jgi:hypothetical protein
VADCDLSRAKISITKARYREPYNARHSSVTWNLMIGKNPLWVGKQHGHSVHTMLETYAAWIEGANDSDIEAIRQSMQSSVSRPMRAESGVKSVVSSARFGTRPNGPEAKSQTHKGKAWRRERDCSAAARPRPSRCSGPPSLTLRRLPHHLYK